MSEPGRRYTGFWPFERPLRQPRPGPGAPRVLSPFRRLAEGKASNSSSVSVAATAEMEPAGGPIRRGFARFGLEASVDGDDLPDVSSLISAPAPAEGVEGVAKGSSASSSSDDIAWLSLCIETSAVVSTVEGFFSVDVSPDAAELDTAEGTRNRTLNAVIYEANFPRAQPHRVSFLPWAACGTCTAPRVRGSMWRYVEGHDGDSAGPMHRPGEHYSCRSAVGNRQPRTCTACDASWYLAPRQGATMAQPSWPCATMCANPYEDPTLSLLARATATSLHQDDKRTGLRVESNARQAPAMHLDLAWSCVYAKVEGSVARHLEIQCSRVDDGCAEWHVGSHRTNIATETRCGSMHELVPVSLRLTRAY